MGICGKMSQCLHWEADIWELGEAQRGRLVLETRWQGGTGSSEASKVTFGEARAQFSCLQQVLRVL